MFEDYKGPDDLNNSAFLRVLQKDSNNSFIKNTRLQYKFRDSDKACLKFSPDLKTLAVLTGKNEEQSSYIDKACLFLFDFDAINEALKKKSSKMEPSKKLKIINLK